MSATVTPMSALSIATSACATAGAFASAVSIDPRRSASNADTAGRSAGTTSASPPIGSAGSLRSAFSWLPASESARRAWMTSALRASTVATAFAYSASVASNSRRFARMSRTSSPALTSHSALTSRARALTRFQYACSTCATTSRSRARRSSAAIRPLFAASRTSASETSSPNQRRSGCVTPSVTAVDHAGSGVKRFSWRLSILRDPTERLTEPPEVSGFARLAE